MSDDLAEYYGCRRWDVTFRKLCTDLCEAKASSKIRNALQSIPPPAGVLHITAPTRSSERRLIMRDGVEDGVMTQTENLVARLASNRRIPKRVSNSFTETVKRDDSRYSIRQDTAD
jgi:hypothetical protein